MENILPENTTQQFILFFVILLILVLVIYTLIHFFQKREFHKEIRTMKKLKRNPLLEEMFLPLLSKGHIKKNEFEKIVMSDISALNSNSFLIDLFGQSRTNEIETAMKLSNLKSK